MMVKNLIAALIVIILGVIVPTAMIFNQSTAVRSNEENELLEADDVIFVSVRDRDGNVNKMDLDTYLISVVLCEMPADFSLEALKAQAVVARTYTLRRVEMSKKHEECDVCMDSSCCQGYLTVDKYLQDGGDVSAVMKVRSAVYDTRNIVLTYNDELIDATYFSSSGGMTEDAVAVWGIDVPYLQSTESPGEESAKHYDDTIRFSSKEFSSLLGVSSTKEISAWIENISYTQGGGVDTICICGKKFKGTEIRRLLNLRSTAFRILPEKDYFLVETKGYGHRVGMSQYGAEAMALNGYSYKEILTHYYKNIQISQFSTGD